MLIKLVSFCQQICTGWVVQRGLYTSFDFSFLPRPPSLFDGFPFLWVWGYVGDVINKLGLVLLLRLLAPRGPFQNKYFWAGFMAKHISLTYSGYCLLWVKVSYFLSSYFCITCNCLNKILFYESMCMIYIRICFEP